MSAGAAGPDRPTGMTAPDPAGAAALYEQAAGLRRAAEELDAALAGVSALAGELSAAWSDLVGRGWAQRLDLVGRELATQADAAAELVRATTDLADGAIEAGPPSAPERGTSEHGVPERGTPEQGASGYPAGFGAPAGYRPGPRLGGTDGVRAGDRRGVVVPTMQDGPG